MKGSVLISLVLIFAEPLSFIGESWPLSVPCWTTRAIVNDGAVVGAPALMGVCSEISSEISPTVQVVKLEKVLAVGLGKSPSRAGGRLGKNGQRAHPDLHCF